MRYEDKEIIFHVYECADGTTIIRERKGELVRCGECKHKRDQKNGHKFCGLHGAHYGILVTNDFFCRDGERKDTEK